MLFRLKDRKWKYMLFHSGIQVYPYASGCLNCGLVFCPSDPKAMGDYFRRCPIAGRPDQQAGDYDPIEKCHICGGDKVEPGLLKGRSNHLKNGAFLYGRYFSPGHLKEKMTFPTGVETAGAILAFRDCGTIFLEVHPFKLDAFINKKCEPDYAASVLKESPPPPLK